MSENINPSQVHECRNDSICESELKQRKKEKDLRTGNLEMKIGSPLFLNKLEFTRVLPLLFQDFVSLF